MERLIFLNGKKISIKDSNYNCTLIDISEIEITISKIFGPNEQ